MEWVRNKNKIAKIYKTSIQFKEIILNYKIFCENNRKLSSIKIGNVNLKLKKILYDVLDDDDKYITVVEFYNKIYIRKIKYDFLKKENEKLYHQIQDLSPLKQRLNDNIFLSPIKKNMTQNLLLTPKTKIEITQLGSYTSKTPIFNDSIKSQSSLNFNDSIKSQTSLNFNDSIKSQTSLNFKESIQSQSSSIFNESMPTLNFKRNLFFEENEDENLSKKIKKF
jgi:hypothetical protein